MLFLDMHLYSNNLSTRPMISSLIMSELFRACNSYSNNFNLPQNLSRSIHNKLVEFFEAMIAGDLSNLILDLSRSLLRCVCLILKFIFFPNS